MDARALHDTPKPVFVPPPHDPPPESARTVEAEPKPDTSAAQIARDGAAFVVEGAARLFAGDAITDWTKDKLQVAFEDDTTTAARAKVGGELKALVGERAQRRIGQLRDQVAEQRLAYLGEDGRSRRDALRPKIRQAVALRHEILGLQVELGNAAWQRPVDSVASYAADELGLALVPGSAAALDKQIEAKTKALQQMLRDTPALGAVSLWTSDPDMGDAELQSKLQEGFAEADAALVKVSHSIAAGDLSLGELEPLVPGALRQMQVSEQKAAAGDPRSRLALEYLAHEAHDNEANGVLLTLAGTALTVVALLTTGPLAAAAIGTSGVAVNVGAAAFELDQAEEAYAAADAGLEGNSGLTNHEVAEARLWHASVNMGLAITDGAIAVRGVQRGLTGVRGSGAAQARVSLPQGEVAEAVPQRAVTPREPTWRPGADGHLRPPEPPVISPNAETIANLPPPETPTMPVRPARAKASAQAPAPKVRAPAPAPEAPPAAKPKATPAAPAPAPVAPAPAPVAPAPAKAPVARVRNNDDVLRAPSRSNGPSRFDQVWDLSPEMEAKKLEEARKKAEESLKKPLSEIDKRRLEKLEG